MAYFGIKVLYTVDMKKIAIVGSLFALPIMASAQFGGVDTFFTNISTFINSILIPLIFAVALLVFLYGVFKYFILGGGNESAREEGKKLVMYSIVGFVLMVSIWGIVNLLAGNLFPDQTPPSIPGGPEIGG
ncbi:MAG: hypothetical protein ACI9H6_000350 [Patiriisocius sp.]|jgi:hypothetical protein